MFKAHVPDFARIIRRFVSRWSRFDDVIYGLELVEDGGRSTAGRKALRMLRTARHVFNHPEREEEALRAERSNAMTKLRKPLAEAVGHIITIELASDRLEELAAKRAPRRDPLPPGVSYRAHVEFLDTLHAEFGIAHGEYRALKEEHRHAIARYIRKRAMEEIDRVPQVKTRKEADEDGTRGHVYWTPFSAPNDPTKYDADGKAGR